MKVLLLRTDKLGDLIQTLPAVELVYILNPTIKITLVTGNNLKVIAKENPYIENVIEKKDLTEDFLVNNKFNLSISFWFDKELALKLFKTIPLRYGRYSKMLSFFSLNLGLRQSRSKALKNEAEYNIDLVNYAFNNKKKYDLKPKIFIESNKENYIPVNNLPIVNNLPEKYIVLSPQMNNSSKNINNEIYFFIADYLRKRKKNIIVTGIKEDNISSELEKKYNCINFCGKTNLRELIYIIKKSEFVIAPNTGTVHLANALSKKIFSIYPISGSSQKKRWQPWKYEGVILDGLIKGDSLTAEKNLIVEGLDKLIEN